MSNTPPVKGFVYCLFGDAPAIPVIDALRAIKTRKLATALQDRSASDYRLWSGQLVVTGQQETVELSVGIFNLAPNNDELFRSLGFGPEDRLLVDGTSSPSNNLVDLFSGQPNVAYLRDYRRYPIERYETLAAIQLLDSFAVHRYLRQKKEPRFWRRNSRRDVESLHLVSA